METLVPLVVAIPLIMAALLAATNPIMPRRLADVFGISTASGVCVMSYLLAAASSKSIIVYWFGGWMPRGKAAVGICFVVDPISGSLAAFAGLLATCALVFSWRYFKSVGTLYHTLMLVFLAALCGFSLTGDLFTMFVFFELMSVSAYALTGYKIEESSLEGALNFGVTNTVGGYLFLLGIGLVYGRTGALNFAQIGQTLAGNPADGLVRAALLLIFSGLFIKAAIVPFHFWLDDANAVAPTPVCVMFSGLMVGLGLYGAARIFWTVFSAPFLPHIASLREILIIAGVITGVVGGLMCLLQRHIKRLLAFSTISHSGIILAGIGALSSKALAGAMVYLVGHGMVKGALFLCAGILLHRFSSVDELDLHGKGRGMIVTAVVLVIGALGLSGVEPFSLALGKGWIEESMGRLGYHWVGPVLTLASAFTAAAVLRFIGRIFLGWGASSGIESEGPTERESPETSEENQRTPVVMLAPAVLLLILSIALGHVPAIKHEAQGSAHIFLDRTLYVDRVIGGMPLRPAGGDNVAVATESTVLGFVSAVVAILIALGFLLKQLVPEVTRHALGALPGPFVKALQWWHRGHIGDYVTWIVVGVAIFGLALFATR